MAFINFQPKDFFTSISYSGNGSNNHAITGVGFAPDYLLTKETSGARNWYLADSVRGTEEELRPNDTNHTAGDSALMDSFDSDGFTLDDSNSMNSNGSTYYAACFKGGTTSGITTNGSTVITPTAYSFNATSGFAALKYTGNGNTTTKVAHGLGKVPTMIWIKKTSASGDNWMVYMRGIGNDTAIQLDNTGATSGGSDRFYDTTHDTVNFTLGNHTSVNASGQTYMAYVWCDVPGFSKTGYYKANASSNGPFIYTGFKPRALLIKCSSTTSDWSYKDREKVAEAWTSNYNAKVLMLNTTAATDTDSTVDFLANGWKNRDSSSPINTSGETFQWFAWGDQPIVSSNNIPGVAE